MPLRRSPASPQNRPGGKVPSRRGAPSAMLSPQRFGRLGVCLTAAFDCNFLRQLLGSDK
jgi:hypothetical protein